MITGRMALSSKLPCEPAKATAASSPRTWILIITIASHWVGLTFPGMIDDPGSFAGSTSSAKPVRGPEANQRMSFAIFISATARPRKAAWARTIASSEPNALNLFGAVINAFPVRLAMMEAISRLKPGGAFRPVPTAVPPAASSSSPTRL
jgi:hypothetical protein